ncbi:MAG: PAS domain-containing protein, partial [Gammaproteobacteria bacterium]|nr:PAS domain-containing protein [Gammaproteobacteria bacterium]
MTNNTEKTKEQLQEELNKAQTRITELELNDRLSKDSKFFNVIKASPVPYALNDDSQNITYLNPAFIKTFGYDLSDIPTLEDWWPRAYPDPEYQQQVARIWQTH